MESTKMNKMIKLARILNKLVRVLKVCTIILGVLVLLGLVVSMVLRNFLIENEYLANELVSGYTYENFLYLGPISIEFLDELSFDISYILSITWIAVAFSLPYVAITYYTFGVIQKILTPMAEGTPFTSGIGNHVRKLAFAFLGVGIMENVDKLIGVWETSHYYDLYESIFSSQVTSITANFNFDFSFLITALIIWLLSYVFSYGEELQKLSDETL